MTTPFVHRLALCESEDVGAGTRIWAFAQVMKGARIGRDCNIGGHAFVETGAAIGDRVTVKNGVMVWNGVTIEDDVFLGPGVVFTNDRYPRSPRMAGVPVVARRYEDESRWLVKAHVERGASIGAGAVIGPGVRVGAFALVAAGAVVTRDVAPHQLVVGVPARDTGWVCFCGRGLDRAPTAGGTCQHGADMSRKPDID